MTCSRRVLVSLLSAVLSAAAEKVNFAHRGSPAALRAPPALKKKGSMLLRSSRRLQSKRCSTVRMQDDLASIQSLYDAETSRVPSSKVQGCIETGEGYYRYECFSNRQLCAMSAGRLRSNYDRIYYTYDPETFECVIRSKKTADCKNTSSQNLQVYEMTSSQVHLEPSQAQKDKYFGYLGCYKKAAAKSEACACDAKVKCLAACADVAYDNLDSCFNDNVYCAASRYQPGYYGHPRSCDWSDECGKYLKDEGVNYFKYDTELRNPIGYTCKAENKETSLDKHDALQPKDTNKKAIKHFRNSTCWKIAAEKSEACKSNARVKCELAVGSVGFQNVMTVYNNHADCAEADFKGLPRSCDLSNEYCQASGLPVDCVGEWGEWSECQRAKENKWVQVRMFKVSQIATGGGKACHFRNGEEQEKSDKCRDKKNDKPKDKKQSANNSSSNNNNNNNKNSCSRGLASCSTSGGESGNCCSDYSCDLAAIRRLPDPTGIADQRPICWYSTNEEIGPVDRERVARERANTQNSSVDFESTNKSDKSTNKSDKSTNKSDKSTNKSDKSTNKKEGNTGKDGKNPNDLNNPADVSELAHTACGQQKSRRQQKSRQQKVRRNLGSEAAASATKNGPASDATADGPVIPEDGSADLQEELEPCEESAASRGSATLAFIFCVVSWVAFSGL